MLKNKLNYKNHHLTPEPKKGFESSGNDVLGGIDLSGFEPR